MKKRIFYILAFLAVLAGFYILGRISTSKERSLNLDNLKVSRDSIRHLIVEIEGKDNFIVEKDAIILSQKDAIETGLIEKERLKALHIKEIITNAKLQGVIKRQDSLLNLPPNTVYITVKDSSGLTHDYIKIPFTLLNEHDKYLSLDAGIDSLRKAWYKSETPVSGEMTIGYKRDGLFKTKPVGIFTTENPNLKINNADILIIDNRKVKRWGIGAFAGYGFNISGDIKGSIFIGAGITYDIITF